MIVIVTYEAMPDKSPGAIRCNSFAQAYAKMGQEVVVLHKGKFISDANPKMISCYNDNRYKQYFGFSRTVKQHLDNLIQKSKIDAVITYGYFKPIARWCEKSNITCVVDVVEWYSKEQFKRWCLSIKYWLKNIEIRNIVHSKVNVIAISSFLEHYFRERGHKTVRIPIIVENTDRVNRQELDFGKLKIIYAGSHLLMDNIALIIKALSKLNVCEKDRLQLNIYGLNREKILQCVSEEDLALAGDSINILGRKPNKEIIEAYQHTHFSICLRDPNLRVNKAGFPSKVVESMKLGVPVICNYSSDLSLYLTPGSNAIIVNSLTEEDLRQKFRELLKLCPDDYSELSNNASTSISEKLSASAFKNELRTIIN